MDLMELLPNYYEDNLTMEELQRILSTDADNAEKALSDLISESFLDSANSCLDRYERIFGIPVEANKDRKFRIDRIRTKMMGQGTVTKEFIKNVSEQYSNGIVDVEEDSGKYIVKIIFTGTIGIPPNLEDLKATLKEIIPAHLQIEYVFIYNTHETLKRFTHQQLKAYTHEQIRNTRLV